MSVLRKALFILHMALNAVLLAVVLSIALFLFKMDSFTTQWHLIGLAAFSLAVCGLYRAAQFKRLVTASNTRMRNPAYRQKLQRLGFLKSAKENVNAVTHEQAHAADG